MNKPLKYGGITFGVLLAVITVLRLSGLLQYYSMPTSSMAPNYSAKDFIVCFKALEYKNGDAVAIKIKPEQIPSGPTGQSTKDEVWMKRLIGKPGDSVQIKNGYASVNGKLMDVGYDILRLYKMEDKNVNPQIFNQLTDDQKELIQSKVLFLTPNQAESFQQYLKLDQMDLKPQVDISNQAIPVDEAWTNGNWGPVLVPEGQVFVLGDNRDNSLDSRTIGFIPAENILSKVVFKF